MDKIPITKFVGEDFAVWRFQIESVLAVNDLWDVVDGSRLRPDENDVAKAAARVKWDKADRKAMMYIGAYLDTKVLRQVEEVGVVVRRTSRRSTY